MQTYLIAIKGKGIPLLSKQTARKLGMLKIEVDIAAVIKTSELLKQQYPEVFSGVGKINTKQISLDISPGVKPVVQLLRHMPFNLRHKVIDSPETQNIANPWACLIDGKARLPEHKHEAEQYVQFVAINVTLRAMNTLEMKEASHDQPVTVNYARRAIENWLL